MTLLVCGGAGFIGSSFVRLALEDGEDVVVLDKLTYAGRRENLAEVETDPRFRFIHGAIEDRAAVAQALDGVDATVNFAAETHVDRSIQEPDAFVHTHALGTYVLLEAARERGIRHLQVSTDEVYGSIAEGSFTEDSPLRPSSPYSATKAGADLLVSSYHETFGLETLVCRGSNNYGPYQHPEKLIPLIVLNAIAGDPLPVYGDGLNVRNWLFVEDFAAAIAHVLRHGGAGEVYNVGGPDECSNIEVVRRILELCGRDESLIEYVSDRPGHDRRYSLGSEKVRGLGWSPRVRFAEGLERTVAWYRENGWWWEPIRSGAYREYYLRQYGRRSSCATLRGAPLLANESIRQPAGSSVRRSVDDLGAVVLGLHRRRGARAVHDDRLDRQREVADRLQLSRHVGRASGRVAQPLHDRRVEHVLADVRRIGAARIAGKQVERDRDLTLRAGEAAGARARRARQRAAADRH